METIGPIFAGIGALELLAGLFFFFRTRRFLESAVSAQGTVVGFEESHESYSSESGGPTYRPIVEFTSGEGQTRKFTDSMASNPPGFKEGETVPVKYDRADPQKARLYKPFRLWFLPALLGSMGMLFLVLGLISLAA